MLGGAARNPPQFRLEPLPAILPLALSMQLFDPGLEPERDENADDNHRDFVEECFPAVQRPGKMNVEWQVRAPR